MNEQPSGQPAEGAENPTSAPAAGEAVGWRPPSEQVAGHAGAGVAARE